MSAHKGKKSISSKSKKKVGESRTKYQVRGKHTVTSRKSSIIKKCKETLVKHYGKRLSSVILYGSIARGQANRSSDIDLLVLLTPPLDYFAELRQLVDMLYPIQLESDRLISAKPASVKDFDLGRISLYRNAKQEGVAI